MINVIRLITLFFLISSSVFSQQNEVKPTENSVIVETSSHFIHYIGEKHAGGIIFNLWKDAKGVEHGVVVSLVDMSPGMVWSTFEKATGATSLDDGVSNTRAIIRELDNCETCAAGVCYAYEGGGFKDWYLPASWELYELSKQVHLINKILIEDEDEATTLISSDYYWSSTEGSDGSAWRQNFQDSKQKYYYHKYSRSRVRAIRRF